MKLFCILIVIFGIHIQFSYLLPSFNEDSPEWLSICYPNSVIQYLIYDTSVCPAGHFFKNPVENICVCGNGVWQFKTGMCGDYVFIDAQNGDCFEIEKTVRWIRYIGVSGSPHQDYYFATDRKFEKIDTMHDLTFTSAGYTYMGGVNVRRSITGCMNNNCYLPEREEGALHLSGDPMPKLMFGHIAPNEGCKVVDNCEHYKLDALLRLPNYPFGIPRRGMFVSSESSPLKQIEIFAEPHYKGEKFTININPGCYDIVDFNDKALSIRAGTQCLILWKHYFCRGHSVYFDQQNREGLLDLATVGLNLSLSAIEVCEGTYFNKSIRSSNCRSKCSPDFTILTEMSIDINDGIALIRNSTPPTVGTSTPSTVGTSTPTTVLTSTLSTVGTSTSSTVGTSTPSTVGTSTPSTVGTSTPSTIDPNDNDANPIINCAQLPFPPEISNKTKKIIKAQTQRMITSYYDSILLGNRAPIVPLVEYQYFQTARLIFEKKCPDAEVPHVLLRSLLLMFRVVLNESLTKYPYLHMGDSEEELRLQGALDSCLKVASEGKAEYVFNYNKTVCPAKFESVAAQIGQDKFTPVNSKTSCDISFNTKKFDYFTEVAWKMVMFAHYYCARHFNQTAFDHSRLEYKLRQLFTKDIVARWYHQGLASRAVEHIFQSYDLERFRDGVDRCITVAKSMSPYRTWIKRPQLGKVGSRSWLNKKEEGRSRTRTKDYRPVKTFLGGSGYCLQTYDDLKECGIVSRTDTSCLPKLTTSVCK